MIKAVFFDWFSTLAQYDPPREHLQAQVLRELGLNVSPAQIQQALVLADKELYTELADYPMQERTPEGRMQVLIHHQQSVMTNSGIKAEPGIAEQVIKRLRELNAGTQFALYDDVIPTISKLKERRLSTGLLTNIDRRINQICRELGLEPYLDVIISSEEAGAEKPNPEIFNLALERAGVIPGEAIHVGDQYLQDVIGARNVGIRPIFIDRLEVFPEVTDCPRIRGLDELVTYLDSGTDI